MILMLNFGNHGTGVLQIFVDFDATPPRFDLCLNLSLSSVEFIYRAIWLSCFLHLVYFYSPLLLLFTPPSLRPAPSPWTPSTKKCMDRLGAPSLPAPSLATVARTSSAAAADFNPNLDRERSASSSRLLGRGLGGSSFRTRWGWFRLFCHPRSGRRDGGQRCSDVMPPPTHPYSPRVRPCCAPWIYYTFFIVKPYMISLCSFDISMYDAFSG